MMFNFIVLSVTVSLLGLCTLFIKKWKLGPKHNDYYIARALLALFGISLILSGFYLYNSSIEYTLLVSPYLVIVGAQISLWAIGVYSQILGTMPFVRRSQALNLNTESLNGLKLAFACLALVFAVAVFRDVVIGPSLFSKVNFIGQANAETLPFKPNWKTVSVKTTDSLGKNVELVIGVLWDPYRWVKGSTKQVTFDEDEKQKLSIESVIHDFSNTETRSIVAVGIASHENALENPEGEITRAQERADTLVKACGDHFINRPRIYSLNLGAFESARNLSVFSASERRVILIVIEKGEDSRDLTSGIRKALAKLGEQQFLFNARDYSLFDSHRFEVIPRLNF